MIFFGTKGRAIKIDTGKFNCPSCKVEKEYEKKYVQDWFTLYFIPVFPIGSKKNEHIECTECKDIYHLDVINYQPAPDASDIESEYEKALKNILCLMILADEEVDTAEIKMVSNIFQNLTKNKKFSENQINKIIKNIKQENLTVEDYLKKVCPYLNDGHRELIIKAMYLVAGADGHLDDKESELLMQTAAVLEMTSAHVKGVLSELDSQNKN